MGEILGMVAVEVWYAAAGAVLLGLVIGVMLGGFGSRKRLREAAVERDVVQIELQQARAEIEGLYDAQRKAAEAAVGDQAADADTFKQELAAREARIDSLLNDLNTVRAEAEQLKAAPIEAQAEPDGSSEIVQTLETQLAEARTEAEALRSDLAEARAELDRASRSAVPNVEKPVPNADPVRRLDAGLDRSAATLEWRNRYLESRVRVLEAKREQARADEVDAQPKAAAEGEAPSQSPPVARLVSSNEPMGSDGGESVEFSKLRWQVQYLRQRLSFMEENAISNRPVAPAPPLEPQPEPAPVAPETTAAAPESDIAEQELARLRWRNRYLEGRLAYLDSAASSPASGDGGGSANPDPNSGV